MNWYKISKKSTTCTGGFKLKRLGKERALEVWLVNGEQVNACKSRKFKKGGHDLRYKFIPDNEIWIDDDLDQAQLGLEIAYQVHERRLMQNGVSEKVAREKALETSKKIRNGRQ